MSSVPSGVVTFLLTDVEGSTTLWSSEPARMSSGTARHYEILDEVIAAHAGVRPVEQGEGDSVVAAFAHPTDAVAAAIEAQTRLIAEIDWLPVRIAVHTGEAILRGEDNYVGPSIIACARVRACAHGRQILVSDATAVLTGDAFTLIDLGQVNLKGFVAPERVWQVTDPGLPADFPPLRGLDIAPNNLPIAATALIGRVDELDRMRVAVARSRLTTLTGAGGCGKTRLALALATESLDSYSGGSWWIELATTSTDDQVANAVATALRIPLVAGADQVDQVVNHLRQIGPTMLVLDNAEHVLDAVARLATATLATCPQLKVMVTSREPLGVLGEEVWRTPSLDLADAAALFGERARKARADLVLDERHVTAICQRLDGIPLAIELAAARAGSLPLDRIAAELSNVFRVLTGGARTSVARQQTLLASIAWSHEMLGAVEQAVLRRLSVFQAPFLLETAEQIVTDGEFVTDLDVLDVVAHLVDKSLVQFDPVTGRYRLLETVRQFAAERLGAHSETATTRTRHAAFYGRYAQRVRSRMLGLVLPDHLWLDLPDLFVALRWSYEASPVDAYRICAINRMARLAIGYLDELAEQVEWLVGRDGHDAPAEWAAAMTQLAQEAITILGRFDLLDELPRFDSSIDPDDADTQFWQSYADGFVGLVTADTSALEAALDTAELRGDATGAIAAASLLATVAAWTGRLDLADSAVARTTKHLRLLDQPLTCDTAGAGHGAAIYAAMWRGHIERARGLVQPDLPKNSFTLFLSALPMAWLGFITADDEIGEIARRWVDRPAPHIQSGAASFVAMLGALNSAAPSELADARAWFDALLHEAATCTALFATPIAAGYLAHGDVQDALAVANDLRSAAATMGAPPLHLAACHQISAMAALANSDAAAAATSARLLISAAITSGFVLMQIDGLELLAMSGALEAEVTATLLGAAASARQRIGYQRRWPNLDAAVIAATEAARHDHSAACERGATLTLDAACSAALTSAAGLLGPA